MFAMWMQQVVPPKFDRLCVDVADFTVSGQQTVPFVSTRQLSLSEVPTYSSLNPYLYVYASRNKALLRYLFMMSAPDTAVNFSLALALYNEGFALTGFNEVKALPVAYQHVRHDLNRASPVFFAMDSSSTAKDVFISGSSTAVNVMVMSSSGASFIQQSMPPVADMAELFRPPQ
jgi:hypothetical protein